MTREAERVAESQAAAIRDLRLNIFSPGVYDMVRQSVHGYGLASEEEEEVMRAVCASQSAKIGVS